MLAASIGSEGAWAEVEFGYCGAWDICACRGALVSLIIFRKAGGGGRKGKKEDVPIEPIDSDSFEGLAAELDCGR